MVNGLAPLALQEPLLQAGRLARVLWVSAGLSAMGRFHADLGAAAGWLGWLLRRVKRSWESPEVCAARLLRVLSQARWASRPGEAAWYFEDHPQPWPAAVERDADAVRRAVSRYLLDCPLIV